MSQLNPKPAQTDSDLQLSEFGKALPMSLLRAREAVMKKFIPALKKHDLSPQQWRVIRFLEQEDGLEMTELAERCFLMVPSMSRISKNLEARGLIKRRTVATDQRRSELFLTNSGRKLYTKIAPKSAERYKHITQQFGKEKIDLLHELLDELVISLKE
ncbi:homoprotocatechuate degradation operon regulator HpaR [Haliea sp. AH-315-K21]|uniref:Homoprotocatechuate degradation operon regulator HpaR n=1 Tax=SAR86 cluster bacterium TaxID=2030880 RepID=A0A2A5C7E8_9GAMM|nr:homoprotocatechuate degradation operon regulator HpaR [Haliea sp. AH-315-K21]PCJ39401.1 MAG: homoprotocatechuate degradation operon regulator HpaR [SAR86 cluster bacterium]